MTVIRRKRRSNFAVIPNSIANDRRLKFEELGLLIYLLSKPDDWSVHVNELKKRGKVGRDKIYKILKRLVELRYMHRVRTKDPKTGQFRGCEYEVRDEPNAPVSPENIAEKPGAVIQETVCSDTPPSTEIPITENPDTLIKHTDTKSPPKKRPPRVDHWNCNTDRAEFGRIFASWPVDPTRSQARAKRRWGNLPVSQKKRAAEGVQNYLDTCQKQKTKPCSILSYLKDPGLWSFSPVVFSTKNKRSPGRIPTQEELATRKKVELQRRRAAPTAEEEKRAEFVKHLRRKHGI